MSEWSKLPYERRAYVLQHLEDEARLFASAVAKYEEYVVGCGPTYPKALRESKEKSAAIARERAHDMSAARQVLVIEGGKDEAPTSQPT